MYGCDNYCTYCIVPYVRGKERSRQAEDIIKEIKSLVADGVTEVMLLGQNVNSYGKTLEKPMTFAALLREISQIEGLKRIRFMTSHPKDLSDELIEVMASHDNICKSLHLPFQSGSTKVLKRMNRHYTKESYLELAHNDELIEVMASHDNICKSLHLPFQSGSTKVLKRMNRHYTKESYLELAHKIKTAMPNIGFTTDIIVGFPGETEEDFLDTMEVVEEIGYTSAFTFIYSTDIIVGFPGETEEDFLDTMEVVEEIGYTSAFTFIYSKRTGTPAATMKGQVEEPVAKERFNRLIALVNQKAAEALAQYQGQVVEVLLEEVSKGNPNVLSGRTDTGILVNVEAPQEMIGDYVPVLIKQSKTHYLFGELAK